MATCACRLLGEVRTESLHLLSGRTAERCVPSGRTAEGCVGAAIVRQDIAFGQFLIEVAGLEGIDISFEGNGMAIHIAADFRITDLHLVALIRSEGDGLLSYLRGSGTVRGLCLEDTT